MSDKNKATMIKHNGAEDSSFSLAIKDRGPDFAENIIVTQ